MTRDSESNLNDKRKLIAGRWLRWDETRAARAYDDGLWVRSTLAEARSEEHTSELQSLMRISYAVFCLKKKKSITLQISTLKQTAHLNATCISTKQTYEEPNTDSPQLQHT